MSRERATALVVAAACGAMALAVYAPAVDFPFVRYDDDIRLLENRPIRTGFTWPNVRWAFSSEWDGTRSPLTWISHMLDFSLYGSDAGKHHRTNLLLHALNAMLLFGALRAATGHVFRAGAVALLFAVHPIHVESVAWVSERKGLLCATFALASLWCYVAYARGGGRRSRRAAVLFFAFSLMAKPAAIVLPLLFLVLDRWPLARDRSPAQLVWEKWPELLVAVAAGVLTLLAQREVGALRELADVTLTARLGNALVTSVLYPWKLVWPRGLASFYPHPGLPGGTPWGVGALLASLAVILLATAAAWRAQVPALRAGLLWYAIGILPTLGIVPVGSQAMADRFAYLPAIGLYIALVFGAWDALSGRLHALRPVAAALFCGVVALLALVSRQQLESWSSSERLFRHATEVTRANYWMETNLADTLAGRGRIEEAIAHYRAAVEIYPGLAQAHFRLGDLLAGAGQPDAAIEQYQLALRSMPRFGAARDALGRLLVEQDRLPEAIAHYRAEAQLRPDSAETWTILSELLRRAGETDEAERALASARALSPRGTPSPEEVEVLLEQVRRPREAP